MKNSPRPPHNHHRAGILNTLTVLFHTAVVTHFHCFVFYIKRIISGDIRNKLTLCLHSLGLRLAVPEMPVSSKAASQNTLINNQRTISSTQKPDTEMQKATFTNIPRLLYQNAACISDLFSHPCGQTQHNRHNYQL